MDASRLEAAPQVGALLKQAEGGLPVVLEAMRFSADPDIQLFLEQYDAVPARDRDSLPWEAIALAAEISPILLLGGAMLALQQHSANTVRLLAVSSHPEVTRKRIEYAQLPGGIRDRDALDTALGFLPSPKGATFIINPQGPRATALEDEEPDVQLTIDGDVDHLFPSVSAMQEKVAPIRRGLLGSGE